MLEEIEVAPLNDELAPGRGRYRVTYERDRSGDWTVDVPDVPGCHTFGETLQQARRYVRDALSLWVDDAETAELVEDIRLPSSAARAVKRSKTARARLEHDQAEASAHTAAAAHALVGGMGLSLRDAGEVLGLSFQRVQQLVRSNTPDD